MAGEDVLEEKVVNLVSCLNTQDVSEKMVALQEIEVTGTSQGLTTVAVTK